jgi:hypothetical protein
VAWGSALAAQEAVTGGEAAPAAPPPRLARVVIERQPVRCFAHDNSPLYLDQLAQGDVVQIGEERGGFVAVTLPLGVTGYVHNKFASAPDDSGFVRTNGKRVSFRYRPRSTEAPADALDDGVALHFLAAEGDWYLVRNPRTPGYVPASAVTTDGDEAALQQGWSELEARRRQEWQQRTTERVEAARKEVELQQTRALLQDLVAQFAAEVGKPWEQQQRTTYVALEAAVEKLAPEFADGSSERLTVASMTQEIRKHILVLDAQLVAKEKLPPAEVPSILEPPVHDPLAGFDLVGWVAVANSSLASRRIRLVRGGRILGYLTCASDRYDLTMFEGVEVGVVGPKEASADGTWLLDVQRMDVLGVSLR